MRSERQHQALLAAVAAHAPAWSEADRTVAAAIFDMLWSVAGYERMVVDWEIDPADATRGITLGDRAAAPGHRRRHPTGCPTQP